VCLKSKVPVKVISPNCQEEGRRAGTDNCGSTTDTRRRRAHKREDVTKRNPEKEKSWP
jgi:hypothetical protein